MNNKPDANTKLYYELALAIIIVLIAGAYLAMIDPEPQETASYKPNLSVSHVNNTNIIYIDGNQAAILNDSLQPDDSDRYIISQFYNLNDTK